MKKHGAIESAGVQTVRGDLESGPFRAGTKVKLEEVTARNVDFGGLTFGLFVAERSEFERCSFEGAAIRFGQLGLGATVYRNCSFRDCDLRGVDVAEARFENCSFADAKIEEWMTYCAEFVDCDFATRIVNCVFSATPRNCSHRRRKNDFRGNDFSRAELIDTVFIGGVDLDLQRWPTSEDYVRIDDAPRKIAAAKAAAVEWDPQDREEALVELEVLSRFAENQDALFVRRVDAGLRPDLSERFWALLSP
jgi:hypothetical protein